ncbi:RabGAP/TBC protein [Dunaliella salina]|uniref:RabGAP/TBC protein n=1 Tax=Dunaliella salina TaxID=3046 RepID=A0ABQ7GFN8_DUNSA|nr:RabGAP/TBC protein [Dunaliella salina]|eukprot:KAF5833418.1 RabGAP/TBC protein [Dunaliella salina]
METGGDEHSGPETDELGFLLPHLTEQQQADRQRSHNAAGALGREEWTRARIKRRLPRPRVLKKLLRKGGVPADLRPWVWFEISGASSLKASRPPAYYSDLVAASNEGCACARQIELDLPRTFVNHPWLMAPEGQAVLRTVLLAFSLHDPKLGYCQGLNYVAALFLLASGQDSERAFWLLAAMVGRVVAANTYGSNLVGCHSEMRTLGVLMEKKMPRLHKHFQDLGCDVSIIATDWFLCLFATSLPPEVAARVWDVLLYEGSKILFRTSLALLKTYEALLITMDNSGELMHALKHSTGQLWAADRLLSTAFKGIGGLPRAQLDRIRRKQHAQVAMMLREREAKRMAADRQQQQEQQGKHQEEQPGKKQRGAARKPARLANGTDRQG